jgi:hypothetical protein
LLLSCARQTEISKQLVAKYRSYNHPRSWELVFVAQVEYWKYAW